MPRKHPDTERRGGPGASHEDRTEQAPKRRRGAPRGAPTNPPTSQVSGGGGERDRHHGHDPGAKRDWETHRP
jgi:hypothetical protein